MKNTQKFALVLPLLILCLAAPSAGSNLANPAAQISDARLGIGMSYYLGGADITDLEIPLIQNRVNARISYSPIRFVNLGVDIGTVQISVDRYTLNGRDTIPLFEGNYGLAAGGHLKLSSPYIADIVSAMAIGNIGYFRSTNKFDAYYGGTDITAAAGLQFRIPNFGCVSFGPQLYMIMGENRGHNGTKGTYSNVNNMRAWIAIDHYFADFNDFAGNLKYYASLEFTASPKINGSRRIPIQEFSISLSIGAITDRLYGVSSDIDN